MNRPKTLPKQSSLSQIVEAANEQSYSKLVIHSDLDELDDSANSILYNLVTTEVEEDSNTMKTKRQAFKMDVEKRAKLPDELFDYIHTAKYQRLFTLT